jgi:hypothetical protein
MGRADVKGRAVSTVHICFAAFSTNERCFNRKLAFLLVDGLPRYAKLPLERRWMRRQEAPLAIIKEARPSRLPVMLKGQFASFLRTDFEMVLKIALRLFMWG